MPDYEKRAGQPLPAPSRAGNRMLIRVRAAYRLAMDEAELWAADVREARERTFELAAGELPVTDPVYARALDVVGELARLAEAAEAAIETARDEAVSD